MEQTPECGGRLGHPYSTEQAPDSDSKLDKVSELAKDQVVEREEDTRQYQSEQLQLLHWREQQQLHREQLDQLKAFKTQLMHDVLTHLSPGSGPKVGTPDNQLLSPDPHQLPLSIEEAGQLFHPLSALPTNHTAADLTPSMLATPTRPPTSAVSESFVSPPPCPPSCSAPTTPTHTQSLATPDNLSTSSLPPQLHHQLPRTHLQDHSHLPPSSSPSPALSMEFPRLPVPSCSHSSPVTATTPSTHTCTPQSILPPEARTTLFQTPPSATHNQQKSKMPFLPLPELAPMPPAECHGSPHTASHYNTPVASAISPLLPQSVNATNAMKAALIEKHSRHMEDLKRYYESQLAELRTNLAHSSETRSTQTLPSSRAKSPLHGNTVTSLERSQSPFVTPVRYASVRSPVLSVADRPDSKLLADNERLKAKSADLQARLEQCNIVNRALEDQVEKQQQYWLEWQNQAKATSHTISVLQDRLEVSRTQLQQQDSIVEQLQADLQMSVGEIQFWKEQQMQEAEKFKQLCRDFEELQKNNKSLQTMQSSLREELSGARRDVGQMEASIRTHLTQEQEFKSTIHKLEERIRHLEHVNNRLHGQATHYTLGSSFPNTPDDDKLQRHSRSPSPTPSCPPPNLTSPLTVSPRCTTVTSTHPHTPLSTHHYSHSHTHADSSKSVPLNRKKWLQPSDPGLILGTPPDSPASVRASRYTQSTTTHPPHPHSSHTSPRDHERHTHPQTSDTTSSEMTSSPLLQSTGQTIVRQFSEEEDPTSLSRRGYINADTDRGKFNSSVMREAKDDLLVDSTLSAIHSGRIRTDSGQPKEQEKESLQKRVERNLRVVADAEERLVELRKEKEKLESVLQRVPRQGGRITRHSKQAQLETERRLEAVEREIGTVRMTLRSHHALRK